MSGFSTACPGSKSPGQQLAILLRYLKRPENMFDGYLGMPLIQFGSFALLTVQYWHGGQWLLGTESIADHLPFSVLPASSTTEWSQMAWNLTFEKRFTVFLRALRSEETRQMTMCNNFVISSWKKAQVEDQLLMATCIIFISSTDQLYWHDLDSEIGMLIYGRRPVQLNEDIGRSLDSCDLNEQMQHFLSQPGNGLLLLISRRCVNSVTLNNDFDQASGVSPDFFNIVTSSENRLCTLARAHTTPCQSKRCGRKSGSVTNGKEYRNCSILITIRSYPYTGW